MKKVGVLNIGYGNINSIIGTLQDIKISAKRINTPEEVLQVDVLILPGVGTFGYALNLLHARDLVVAISERHKNHGFILGICLGFQIMSLSSDEAPDVGGIGIFDYEFKRLSVPQIGWKSITEGNISSLHVGQHFYFNHSFGATVTKSKKDKSATIANSLVAIAIKGNSIGTQFHPEKSQQSGKTFLNWFLRDFAR